MCRQERRARMIFRYICRVCVEQSSEEQVMMEARCCMLLTVG